MEVVGHACLRRRHLSDSSRRSERWIQALSRLIVSEVIHTQLGWLLNLMECQSILSHVRAGLELLLIQIQRLHVLLVSLVLESTYHV